MDFLSGLVRITSERPSGRAKQLDSCPAANLHRNAGATQSATQNTSGGRRGRCMGSQGKCDCYSWMCPLLLTGHLDTESVSDLLDVGTQVQGVAAILTRTSRHKL